MAQVFGKKVWPGCYWFCGVYYITDLEKYAEARHSKNDDKELEEREIFE